MTKQARSVAEIMGAATAPEAKAALRLSINNYVENVEKFLACHPNMAWHQGAFYTWNRRCWEPISAEQIERLLYQFLSEAHYVARRGNELEERPFPITNK